MLFFFQVLFFVLLLPVELFATDKDMLKKILPASLKKNGIYLEDVTFHNKNSGQSLYGLQAIRWAKKKDFERIVLDFQSSPRETKLPYFQINADPVRKRIIVEIKNEKPWEKSDLIKSFKLIPQLKRNLLSMEIKLQDLSLIEAFYLKNPKRIVLDIQRKK